MKDRIILLIKAKNLTAAQFADEIGVQKSSISHIISGRNNASLDFIQKVLLRYPDVSMEWLMFGKGPIFKNPDGALNNSNDGSFSAVLLQNTPPVDLFSELNPDQSTIFRKENEFSPEPTQRENPIPEKEIKNISPNWQNESKQEESKSENRKEKTISRTIPE